LFKDKVERVGLVSKAVTLGEPILIIFVCFFLSVYDNFSEYSQ
jgi:hypothetical protein